MKNQQIVNWCVWIATGILSFIFALNCLESYGATSVIAANLCVFVAFIARRYRVAKIALLLAAIIMFNCSFALGLWKALALDKAAAQFQSPSQ